jgi:hypothetical protein
MRPSEMTNDRADLLEGASSLAGGAAGFVFVLNAFEWLVKKSNDFKHKAYSDTVLPDGTHLHNPLSDPSDPFPLNLLPSIPWWVGVLLIAVGITMTLLAGAARSRSTGPGAGPMAALSSGDTVTAHRSGVLKITHAQRTEAMALIGTLCAVIGMLKG